MSSDTKDTRLKSRPKCPGRDLRNHAAGCHSAWVWSPKDQDPQSKDHQWILNDVFSTGLPQKKEKESILPGTITEVDGSCLLFGFHDHPP